MTRAARAQQPGPVEGSFLRHRHWVERERQMCSERTRDPITLIRVAAYLIEQTRNSVFRGDEEKEGAALIQAEYSFLF